MKKTYEKPQVYMERFELAEHIAGCYFTLNQSDVNTCNGSGVVDDEPISNLFAVQGVCELHDLEDYCYTNGTINVNTITS